MKKLTFLIIVLLVFAAGFVASRYWYSNKSLIEIVKELTSRPVVEVEEAEEAEEAVFVSETSPAVLVSPKEEVAEALKIAFAEKYKKDSADVWVTISELTEEYAAGGVSFGGEVGGGWFLAAKEDGAWDLVADGNGNILCSLVEPYAFPVSMVPECWDEATMSVVTF